MHILTVNNHFRSGGAVEQLRYLHALGHEIEICTLDTLGDMAQPLIDLGVKVYNFEQNPDISLGSRRGKFDLRLALKLANVIRRGGYDIVQVHTFPASLYAALASLIAPEPSYVFTEHSILNRRHQPATKLIDRFIYSRYAAITGVSQSVTDALIAWQPQIKDRVYTVVNGVDTARFQFSADDRAAFRQQLGIASNDVVLFFGGRFVPVKGVDVLIEAVSGLDRSAFKLLLAGSGELEADLREHVSAAGLDDNVGFLGFRDDIPELLAASDVVVLPSHDDELPIILLEAMAAGKPIVASAVGGVPELVTHGVAGLLVPPDDPAALRDRLAQLIGAPEVAATLGAAGRAKVNAEYTIGIGTGQLLDLYQYVLSRRE